MNSGKAWEMFRKSGRIEYYLAYKKAQNQETQSGAAENISRPPQTTGRKGTI